MGFMVEAPLSRTEWAVRRLHEAILSGELAPGERVSSAELAKRWSVSATPLREALQRLAASGLVEYASQRGARVTEVSPRDVREVYELRLMLEPEALGRSMRRADNEWRRELDDAYFVLRTAYEGANEDMTAVERANREFHRALLARCDSEWLLRIVGMLSDNSARYRALSWWPRGGSEKAWREHVDIYEACVSGDTDRAEGALREHIGLTRDAILDNWGTAPRRAEPGGDTL